ncbi:MAG: hypothetical protein ABR953_00065 [Candidatus Acidiferrales bacterium]|jgi:hypothetical protein
MSKVNLGGTPKRNGIGATAATITCPIATKGEVFPDGSTIELIGGAQDGKPRLMLWDGAKNAIGLVVVRHGQTFVPPRIDSTILRSLRLPSNTAEYGSTRKLFTEISGLISRATQAADAVAELLTFFVFATWLTDFLPFAPFVWVVTPPTTTSAPLEQVLSALCRRALVVNDISAAGLYSLTDLQPTVLTEVFQPTRRLLNLFRASTRRGALIAAGGKAVDASCARIVFAPEPLRNPASAGFPLEIVLSPTPGYVPLMSAAEAERVAKEYQAKLLHYRLLNSTKVRTPAFDLSQFTVPVQELAHGLAASIVGDDELQARLVPVLKPVDSEIRVGHASLLTAIALDVLLARCHTHTGKYFPVIELTTDVNTVLRGRGETREVSPENIGWTLRALGLRTDFIPGGRKGLVLSNEVRERIHKLAAAYGARTLREPRAKFECSLCAATELPWKMEAKPA